MKKILLLAYTNFNFGDDMFIKTICNYFADEKFVIETPEKYTRVFKNINNIEIIHTNRVEKILNKITKKYCKKVNILLRNCKLKQYKAVVYTIGALFDENEIWWHSIEKYGAEEVKNMLWKESLSFKVPFFLLGCNMTKVLTKEYLEQMNYLFEGITDICFRDQYSYDFFKELKNTRYAPDIVFNYKCQQYIKNGGVLISVWGVLTQTEKFPQWKWAEDLWADYEKFIIDITETFLKRGVQVTLLGLCEEEGDLKACNSVLEHGMFGEDVKVVSYNGNIDEVIRLFEKAEFVIGTRFHSIVMAMNAACSFYPIIYERKTMELLKDLGYKNEFSHIEMKDSYDVKAVIRLYENGNIIDCKKIKKMASDQFRKLTSIVS